MKFLFWIFKDSKDQSKIFCQNNRTEIRLQIAGSDEDHKTCKPQYYSSVPKAFREIELKYDFTNRKGRENELHEKEKEKQKRNGTEEENIQCNQRTADIKPGFTNTDQYIAYTERQNPKNGSKEAERMQASRESTSINRRIRDFVRKSWRSGARYVEKKEKRDHEHESSLHQALRKP